MQLSSSSLIWEITFGIILPSIWLLIFSFCISSFAPFAILANNGAKATTKAAAIGTATDANVIASKAAAAATKLPAPPSPNVGKYRAANFVISFKAISISSSPFLILPTLTESILSSPNVEVKSIWSLSYISLNNFRKFLSELTVIFFLTNWFIAFPREEEFSFAFITSISTFSLNVFDISESIASVSWLFALFFIKYASFSMLFFYILRFLFKLSNIFINFVNIKSIVF